MQEARIRIGVILVLALLGAVRHAHSQSADVNSANAALPGCVETLGTSPTQGFGAGYCVGMVRVILNTASMWNSCPPTDVTPALAVRVVVAYVNQKANRMHESFEVLAVEAMRDAWPCK
jgi:hypothetical protein